MKPNAAFMGSGAANGQTDWVPLVYSRDTQMKLAGMLNLNGAVYTRADLGSPALAEAEILFSTWGMPALTQEEIAEHLPRLRVLFYAAGTVQSFARPFLCRGVRVVSAWAANAVPVAEFACAQIILANKGYFRAASLMRSEGYAAARSYSRAFPGSFGGAVGILGVGMIGRKVIEMLRANDIRLRILAFDPFLPDGQAEALGIRLCSLEEIFTQCQTVSNHLANNAETKGMLDYALFGRMKPNAAFVNTGRGAQVAEADLIRALREAPGRTALLDVTDPEPPEPGHPFFTLPNVFLSAHVAGSTGDEPYRMGEYMLEEAERFLDGRPLRYEVTEDMLTKMA